MHHRATLTTSSSTFARTSGGSSSGRSLRRSTRSFFAFYDGVEVHQKGVSGGKFVSFRTGRRMNASNLNAIGKGTKRITTYAKQEKDKLARDTIDLSKRKIGPGKEAPVKVTFLGANDSSVTVDCPTDQYVLDAALEAGLELPFTCRGGICGACVAKCVSGATDQSDITDLEFTLDEDEQKEGLTLLCMAYPVGDCVIETQSDWGMRVGEWKGATGEILGRDPTKLMDDDPNRIGL